MKRGTILKAILSVLVLLLGVGIIYMGYRLGKGTSAVEPVPDVSVQQAGSSAEAEKSGTAAGTAESSDSEEEVPMPTETPEVTEAPTEIPTETPTPEPIIPEGNGIIVCIDPGHQDHGISETEPNGPGSSVMKAKVTTGTDGAVSGKSEYEVVLEIGLRLRDELEKRGYTVVMTRETNDTDLSNVDRAVIANDAGADIFVRLHCNGSDDPSVKGALCYQPSYDNPYLSREVISGSQRLSTLLLDNQIRVTNQDSMGLLTGDDMTGINWAAMPVSIVEMGFMSNPEEDRYMASEEGQMLISIGLANGVDAYFSHAASNTDS